MGGQPWNYFVPFETSVEAALEKLRQKVFASGEFNRSELKPATMEQALENSGEEGTRSILDILQVGETPDFCTVCPLPDEELQQYFGTEKPTHEMVADNYDFYDNIERGQGIFIVVFKDDEPSEYFFAGYSFD